MNNTSWQQGDPAVSTKMAGIGPCLAVCLRKIAYRTSVALLALAPATGFLISPAQAADPVPAAAAEPAAGTGSTPPVAPSAAAAPAQPRKAHPARSKKSRKHKAYPTADLRHCLDESTDHAIIRCAER